MEINGKYMSVKFSGKWTKVSAKWVKKWFISHRAVKLLSYAVKLWLLWLVYLGERQGNSKKGNNSLPELKQKYPWEKEFECVAEIKLDEIYGWNEKLLHMERSKYKSFYGEATRKRVGIKREKTRLKLRSYHVRRRALTYDDGRFSKGPCNY